MALKTVTFYLDFISPFAYLAFEKLPQALQGLSYSAAQALQMGLVNEVIEENSDAAWQQTLTRLMRAAPGAVASTKQLLRQLRGE